MNEMKVHRGVTVTVPPADLAVAGTDLLAMPISVQGKSAVDLDSS